MARTKQTARKSPRTTGKGKGPRKSTGKTNPGMFTKGSKAHTNAVKAGTVRKPVKKTRFGPLPNKRVKQRKNGLAALSEIRRWQTDPGLLLPRLPFARVVREVMQDLSGPGKEYRIQAAALQALQEATEAVLVQEFELAHHGTIHAKRVTLQVKDMQLVRRMRFGMLGYAYPGGLGGKPEPAYNETRADRLEKRREAKRAKARGEVEDDDEGEA